MSQVSPGKILADVAIRKETCYPLLNHDFMIFSREKIILILLILLWPVFTRADHVILQNGTRYEGHILSADSTHIYLQITDTSKVRIPGGMVKTVFFRYSDLLYLLSGNVIECKIIAEVFPDLIFITAGGEQRVKLIEVKRYFYSAADSLESPYLPPTGKIFNNQKIFEQEKRNIGKYLMVGVYAGVSNLPADDWNSRFITASKLLGFSGGFNLSYPFYTHIFSNLGFEYTWYDNEHEDLYSIIKKYFLFTGLSYQRELPFIRNVYVSAGAELGIQFLSGNTYLFSYRNVKLNNSGIKPGIRPFLALETDMTNRVKVRTQIGYLSGPPFSINPGPDYLEKIGLNYNGPIWTIHLLYRIPLKN